MGFLFYEKNIIGMTTGLRSSRLCRKSSRSRRMIFRRSFSSMSGISFTVSSYEARARFMIILWTSRTSSGWANQRVSSRRFPRSARVFSSTRKTTTITQNSIICERIRVMCSGGADGDFPGAGLRFGACFPEAAAGFLKASGSLGDAGVFGRDGVDPVPRRSESRSRKKSCMAETGGWGKNKREGGCFGVRGVYGLFDIIQVFFRVHRDFGRIPIIGLEGVPGERGSDERVASEYG